MRDQTTSDQSTRERVARERVEQDRWKPRGTSATLDKFRMLVDCEFAPEEQQNARTEKLLSQILKFAGTSVPYYRDVLAQQKISLKDIGSPQHLLQLPELNKSIIREHKNRLRPHSLPPGQKLSNSHTSSGSTGEPVRVFQTEYARLMRLLLTQRQLRWYRYDPMGSMAAIRSPQNLPKTREGPLPLGKTLELDRWPGVGRFFITGPLLGFDKKNPLDELADWLEQHNPSYLFSTTGMLEQIAMAFQGREALKNLRGIRAMSEPLTPGQRARVENTFKVPVSISYGLNETGWLATRCPEGGRYHVHTEHCLLEVIDDKGKPSRPGKYGRVLVTMLSNAAMPLIRYDTDDIAQAVEGPCACGRTLPAIGDIVGRHSLMKGLPPGTLEIVSAIRAGMDYLPAELSLPVRQYQIRQSLDGNFQLFLLLAGPRTPGFDEYISQTFSAALTATEAYQPGNPRLDIQEVLRIPTAPSKKFFHFVSEFNPPVLEKDQPDYPTLKN